MNSDFYRTYDSKHYTQTETELKIYFKKNEKKNEKLKDISKNTHLTGKTRYRYGANKEWDEDIYYNKQSLGEWTQATR